MSPTLADPNIRARANVIQTAGKESTAVKAKRGTTLVIISLALVSTLAWNALLIWTVGRIIGVWLR
jgi:hypothetical protein